MKYEGRRILTVRCLSYIVKGVTQTNVQWHRLPHYLLAPSSRSFACCGRRDRAPCDVHDQVGDGTSYTTTLKLLQMMHAKGLVKRDDAQRQHIYEAAIDEQRTLGSLVTR